MIIKQRNASKHAGIIVLFFCTRYSPSFAQVVAAPSDLSVASVRKALAAEHAAIAAHPRDPTNYVNLAYTLTDAGMGEQARIAAADATRVAPTNAFAFSAQGWVLRHNSIGVDFGSGFDYDGALRSYRKAIELDPKDLDVRQSLANLLDYSREGVKYAPNAQLPLAIDAYRYVKQHQRLLQSDVVDNLAIDLFYAERYEEAVKEVTAFTGSEKRLGVLLASVAATQGSSAAIANSNRIEGDEQRRKDALTVAAEGLWNKRLYAQAADLLTASLPDANHGAETTAKIQIFRDLKPFTAASLPPSDPRRPVQRLMERAFTGTLDEALMKEVLSRHFYAKDSAWNSAMRQNDVLASTILTIMKQTNLPRTVVADIVLGRMSITAPSDLKLIGPVRMQLTGLAAMQFFVVSEDGTWKIAASGPNASEVGSYALYLLAKGDTEAAKPLLDWYYSLLNRSREGGDPLGGELFLRLWSPKVRSETYAPFAGAALTNDAVQLRPLVDKIIKAREAASAPDTRSDLDLLLATVYLRLHDAPNAHAVTSRLLTQYPESNTAVHLAGQSYALEGDWAVWKALLAKRLQEEPDSRQLLLEIAAEANAEGDYIRAGQAYKHILDTPQAVPADYSMYAWLALFAGKPDESALAAAQQAAATTKSRTYQSLLTLACLNAARGETAEAHQELLDAMLGAGLAEPDAGIWYGFGRIFEQYGAVDAAAAAYQRTVQMAGTADLQNFTPGGESASLLANKRLKALASK